MKRYNIPTTPLVLGLILGPLMERFFLMSLASYVTAAEFLLRPRTAVIMGIAFLFLFWYLVAVDQRVGPGCERKTQ